MRTRTRYPPPLHLSTSSASLSSSSSPTTTTVNEYEELRRKKMKRNHDRLVELGLDKPSVLLEATAAATKKRKLLCKKIPSTNSTYVRRSTRSRKKVNYTLLREDRLSDEDKSNNEGYESSQDDDDEELSSTKKFRRNSDDDDEEFDVSSICDDDDDEELTHDDDDDDKLSRTRTHHINNDVDDEKFGGFDVDSSSDDDDDKVKGKKSTGIKRRRIPNPVKTAIKKETSLPKDIIGGITCEYAKTSRSTCRKCREKIEKDSPRIGMTAWIVGRQAITWQRPLCFLQNLVACHESSGRSKCKLTGQSFKKGELKVGARSHTSTSYYKIEALRDILETVLKWMPSDQCRSIEYVKKNLLNINLIEGTEKLEIEDKERLQCILEDVAIVACSPNKTLQPSRKISQNPKDESKEPNAKLSDADKVNRTKITSTQPQLGIIKKIKGRVQWKFGGHTCFGMLLASRETATHCYARTHKGNVKTLAKGKDYWSVIVL